MRYIATGNGGAVFWGVSQNNFINVKRRVSFLLAPLPQKNSMLYKDQSITALGCKKKNNLLLDKFMSIQIFGNFICKLIVLLLCSQLFSLISLVIIFRTCGEGTSSRQPDLNTSSVRVLRSLSRSTVTDNRNTTVLESAVAPAFEFCPRSLYSFFRTCHLKAKEQ